MFRKVDLQGVEAVRGIELTEDLVSFFISRVFGNPSEAFGHAKNLRIDRKRRYHLLIAH
jgi:hypothetical protein